MSDPIELDPKDMAGLTLLRRLVTGLLVVMICGFLVLIGLLVTRFPDMNAPSTPAISFDLPETITLPKGATATAFTRGDDWVAIVTDDAIMIYDAETGALRQTVMLK
ncbi:DUF6476 family protein [Celeribacter baekdonensis]|uniref:DUF6476 family protein n=1 Tax=Celeribacter baekdonensis TaxID=875171 RepID=UPI003A8F4838